MGVVQEGKDERTLPILTSALSSEKILVKCAYTSWIRYFEKGEGSRMGLAIEAILSYDLSRFVCPSGPEDGMNPFVSSMAVVLIKGERLVLAPIYLVSLYARLDECVSNVVQSVGRYDVVTYVDTSFVQIFFGKDVELFLPNP